MPWKECHVMDERLRFVARLEGEKMPPLCAELGVKAAGNAAALGLLLHAANPCV